VLVVFAERHSIQLEGMSIVLDWKTAGHPHRIGEIEVAVKIPQPLAEDQKRVLMRVAEECLIHNTLRVPPKMEMTLTAEEKKTGSER
jgi:uncharacterized OsmC-like protein